MKSQSGVRLQKFLSQAGVASRRAAETLITDGRVRINGTVVTELGTRVVPERDVVHVDGRRVRPAPMQWYALYKPRGVMSTRSDPEQRTTLYDLVPAAMRMLFTVGRLDYDSEGLILLTNDGDTANRLMHPRYEIEREYDVELEAPIESDALHRMRSGVELEDGFAQPDSVRRRTGDRIVVTLREGRNREVRRLFEAVGSRVKRLRRTRYGPIRLDDLEPGAWRKLSAAEVAAVQAPSHTK